MNDINKMFNSDEINARLKNSFTGNRNEDGKFEHEKTNNGSNLVFLLMSSLVDGKEINDISKKAMTSHITYMNDMTAVRQNKCNTIAELQADVRKMVDISVAHIEELEEIIKDSSPEEDDNIVKYIALVVSDMSNDIMATLEKIDNMQRFGDLLSGIIIPLIFPNNDPDEEE